MKTAEEAWQEWWESNSNELLVYQNPPLNRADLMQIAFLAGRASVNREMAEEVEKFTKGLCVQVASASFALTNA